MTMSSHPTPTDSLDVVVIGAGQAGLAISYHLAQHRLRFLVVDAGPELGHVWRQRWDSLSLFSPSQYDALPGMPFPAPEDTYPTKDQVADYLSSYAEEFDLPVLLNTRVARLERADDRYLLHTNQGVLRARQVVIATGAFQAPLVPELARGLDDEVVQRHSATYRSPADLPSGRVAVVGGGNSGLQIAEELAATRDVIVAVGSRPMRLPQRILGRDLFWWLRRLGLLDKPATLPLAKRMRSRGELVIGGSHRRLRDAGVEFRPRVVAADGNELRFADDTTATVDAVVWATGFRADYSWIDVPGVVEEGSVVHERGLTKAPGLCFIGLPWQHTRGSSLLGFVKHDAEWLAARLLDRHQPPESSHARAAAEVAGTVG